MKKLLIIILLFLQNFHLFAQNCKQDCINLALLKGHNLFLHTKTNKLIEFVGSPDSFTLDRELEFLIRDFKQNPAHYNLTINSLVYQNFVYFEKGDSVCIHNVHFHNEHHYSIVYNDVIFNKYLHIKDFFKYFQVEEQNIVLLNKRKFFIEAKDRVYYTLVALPVCGSNYTESIDFYFDKKGFLESIVFYVMGF